MKTEGFSFQSRNECVILHPTVGQQCATPTELTVGAPLQKIDRLNIGWRARLKGCRSTQTVPQGTNFNTTHAIKFFENT